MQARIRSSQEEQAAHDPDLFSLSIGLRPDRIVAGGHAGRRRRRRQGQAPIQSQTAVREVSRDLDGPVPRQHRSVHAQRHHRLQADGVAAGDRSGFSVASAGDVNGDGFADLIVGAPAVRVRRLVRHELRGVRPSLGLCRQYRSLLARRHHRLQAQRRGGWRPQRLLGRFGRRRQRRRFRRPDRRCRLGRPQRQRYSGASYVVFGKASGFAANIDLSSARRLDRLQALRRGGRRRSGRSVASAGDVNGDGFADLIVGAKGADPHGNSASGASYVVFGQASGFAANIDLSSLDGTTGFKLSGAAAGDFSGVSVASAGDVNGDGFADLIVGACLADPHGTPIRRELCGVRQGLGLCRQYRSVEPRRHHRLQAQRRDGGRPAAASRWPRPATSTATASPT